MLFNTTVVALVLKLLFDVLLLVLVPFPTDCCLVFKIATYSTTYLKPYLFLEVILLFWMFLFLSTCDVRARSLSLISVFLTGYLYFDLTCSFNDSTVSTPNLRSFSIDSITNLYSSGRDFNT